MSWHFWPFLLTLCLLTSSAVCADAPLAVAPQPGVVLLRNGQVMSGKITQAGDFYYVTLPGGEIRLPAEQVELACRDLAEGYERKRGRIDPEKLADHLDLAIWCIRQQLFDEAAREIAEARAISDRHPRIPLVERQLKLAQEQPVTADRKEAVASNAPTNEDLDRLFRGLPQRTVETFANTIQPLLLNTCGNAGCHGPQSESKLRLLRTQFGRTSSRRFTQRNLYAVLEMIDRADPPASPLLTAPVGPHGSAKAAIFTSKEVAQYRQLVQWVMRVAQGPAVEQPTSVDKPDDHLLQRISPSVNSRPAPVANPLLVPTTEESPLTAGAKLATGSSGKGGDKKSPPLSASAEPQGDPLDPEVFNRHYLAPE